MGVFVFIIEDLLLARLCRVTARRCGPLVEIPVHSVAEMVNDYGRNWYREIQGTLRVANGVKCTWGVRIPCSLPR